MFTNLTNLTHKKGASKGRNRLARDLDSERTKEGLNGQKE